MEESYFNKLNYTLANEDTTLEYNILPMNRGHVLSVAGSGARVLPLFAKKPKLVTCVDLAHEQLALCELRNELVRAYNHQEFLAFWGYPPYNISPAGRKKMFDETPLSENARSLLTQQFEHVQWNSLLYVGKWESTFQKISKVARSIIGKHADGLLAAKTMEEQRAYLRSHFPRLKWLFAIALIGNATFFNSTLYKGRFPKKNLDQSFFAFYRDAFDRLFNLCPARENYFLQLVLAGELRYPEGNPIECSEKVFLEIKEGLKTARIEYVCKSVVDAVKETKEKIDFVSISDVPSYFSGELEHKFLNWMHEGLAQDALVVVRNYLHIPEGLDVTGFADDTSKYQDVISKEKTQVYDISIFRKTA